MTKRTCKALSCCKTRLELCDQVKPCPGMLLLLLLLRLLLLLHLLHMMRLLSALPLKRVEKTGAQDDAARKRPPTAFHPLLSACSNLRQRRGLHSMIS